MTFMVHTSSLTPPKQPAKPARPCARTCACACARKMNRGACLRAEKHIWRASRTTPPPPLLFGSFCLQLSYCKAFEPFDIMQLEVKLRVIEFDRSDFYCPVSVATGALASPQEF